MTMALKLEIPVAFTFSPHLDHIEWIDGTLAYCRPCDATVALSAVPGGRDVVCISGHRQHRANLLITRRVPPR